MGRLVGCAGPGENSFFALIIERFLDLYTDFIPSGRIPRRPSVTLAVWKLYYPDIPSVFVMLNRE